MLKLRMVEIGGSEVHEAAGLSGALDIDLVGH